MRSIVAAIVWMATVAMDVAWIWVLIGTDFLNQVQASATDTQLAPIDKLVINLAMGAIAAVTISYVSIGLVLAGRSGAGRIAGVLLAGGFLFAAVPFGYMIGGALVLAAPANPLFNAIFLLGPALYGLGSALILPGLALIFPDGRLPSPAWRAPVGIVVGLLVAGTIVVVVTPGEIATSPGSSNPFGVPGLPEAVTASGLVLYTIGILGISILGVGAVIARYRRGATLARQQLRWFAAAVLLAAVPLAIAFLPGAGGPAWFVLAAVGLLLVPVAVLAGVVGDDSSLVVAASTLLAFALFQTVRRRVQAVVDRRFDRARYDADRTVAAYADRIRAEVDLDAITTGLRAGVRQTIAPRTVDVWLRAGLATVAQGQTVAVAASTLVAFAVFQPIRRRIQAAVDRRFNRTRYDAERTVAAFSARLRDEVDIATVTTDLHATVQGVVKPVSLGLWIRAARP